jgi:hypothetical protein
MTYALEKLAGPINALSAGLPALERDNAPTDRHVRGRYFADLEAARCFQCSVKERASVMSTASIARSKGARMPSIPDDVRAETIRPALALIGSFRNRLDCESFTEPILPSARLIANTRST